MPSPFPGMNPYLERAGVWRKFHHHFITTAMTHLAAQLDPRYLVDIETQLYIHEPPADRRFRDTADGSVADSSSRASQSGGAAPAAVAPVYVTILDEVEIEKVHSVLIRDADGNEVVTVVELLSRSNKYAGPDREQYLRKRTELIRSGTSLVELDLLRGGPRMPPDDMPTCDYCAVVSRVEERPRLGVWPWRLREPMPTIPVPLRQGEAAWLDLKAVLDRLYDEGYYERSAYARPPEPRLSPDDAAWAAQFLPPTAG